MDGCGVVRVYCQKTRVIGLLSTVYKGWVGGCYTSNGGY